MPIEAHKTAASLHDSAAASHRSAAEKCSKGDHSGCKHDAAMALDHSVKAAAASTVASQKSAQHAPAAVHVK